MARHSRYSSDGDLGGAVAGAYFAIVLVVLVILIYLLVKAINLIVRVVAKYPKNKAVWIALGVFLVFSVCAVITKGDPRLVTLAILSFLGLTLTARIVELYYGQLFEQDTTIVDRVLHTSWWEAEDVPRAA